MHHRDNKNRALRRILYIQVWETDTKTYVKAEFASSDT